jgi:hypothetical protein
VAGDTEREGSGLNARDIRQDICRSVADRPPNTLIFTSLRAAIDRLTRRVELTGIPQNRSEPWRFFSFPERQMRGVDGYQHRW